MRIRQAAVAGSFYPTEPSALAQAVDGYLAAGREQLQRGGAGSDRAPKAVIAPHAGYVYSGPIAGTAYAAVQQHCRGIERVVLLGPTHRVRVDGLAASSADVFATPLGDVPIDRLAIQDTLRHPQVHGLDAAHTAEHSLEVQLPFLQRVLGRFELVPFTVGAATHSEVAEILDDLWGGLETLVVVSSDLSHYYDYETARQLDADTAQAIETLRPDQLGTESACGRIPVGGLLLAAQRHGLRAHVVDLRSSGDTAGPRDTVVGYGAFLLA